MNRDENKSYIRTRIAATGKALAKNLDENGGVIQGNCAVVSRNVHFEPRDLEGTVTVDTERDAGMVYFNMSLKNCITHIDVYHSPAEINIFDLSSHIMMSLAEYLDIIEGKEHILSKERKNLTLNLAQRIYLMTSSGEGTVLKPVRTSGPAGGKLMSHIHILASLQEIDLGIVDFIVAYAEKAVLSQGNRLRHVINVISRKVGEYHDSIPERKL